MAAPPRALVPPEPLVRQPRLSSRGGSALEEGERTLPEETAIAFSYGGASHAVMMATPADLEDFAVGFSLCEALIDRPGQIADLTIHHGPLGIELAMTLGARSGSGVCSKRHKLTGPSGCGLCGVENLQEASRPVQWLQPGPRWQLAPETIAQAMAALGAAQTLNRQTHALHAAGFWQPGRGLLALREDVGRHNALDKLAGTLARERIAGAGGMVLLTSRVSVELVQKTARIGAPVIAAVSAPTALAVRTAEACGITLVAVARGSDFEVFSHAGRLSKQPPKPAESSPIGAWSDRPAPHVRPPTGTQLAR